MALQAIGELARVFALAAYITAHMQGLADEQQLYVPARGDLFQLVEIVANAGARERFDSLRGEAELVTYGEANPFLADVQGQHAAGRNVFFVTGQAWIIKGAGRVRVAIPRL